MKNKWAKEGPIYWCTLCERFLAYDEKCIICTNQGIEIGFMKSYEENDER